MSLTDPAGPAQLADLVPVESVPTVIRYRLKGSFATRLPFDFNGEVEIQLDQSGLGEIVRKALLNPRRKAKRGPITVRFRGAAAHRKVPA